MVACGHCIPCLARSRRDWANRLEVEWHSSDNAYFITMTYDEQNAVRTDTGFTTLHKPHIQQFLKDVRNACRKKVDGKWVNFSPRFFLVGEYGGQTERAHYHIIFFNLPEPVKNRIGEIWAKGMVRIAPLNRKRVRYATKYSITRNIVDTVSTDRERPFRMVTKSTGGLGKQWLCPANIHYAKTHLDGMMKTPNGFQPLPKYYKDRIGYTFPEKAIMRANIQVKVDEKYEKEFAQLVALGYSNPGLEMEKRELVLIENIKKKATKSAYEIV